MPRLPDIIIEELTPEQRRVYDAILTSPRGRVEGPLRIWLRSPELAERAQNLGAFCRFGTSLPARLSELAILITGAHWKAGFEWWAHAPIALRAGLEQPIIDALRSGEAPRFINSDEAAVYAFTSELLTTRRVSDATYKRAVDEFGTKTVVELVGILGYYSLISMTIVAFEVALPAAEADPFDG
jgi:4-carboxymuconolactone decarboxylase